MSQLSSYPNGFPSGLTIREMPMQVAFPGKVYWVNNSSVLAPSGVNGSDNNPGTYRKPFSTLAGALTQCTASRGDIIMVMPGHAETVSSSTALTLNVAGVLVVGLGQGSLRPTFTLDTATTATVNVTADNIGILNCVFKANFAGIAACFTLTTAKNFSLSRCEFVDNSSILNFKTLVDTDATSNNADGIWLDTNRWVGLGATSGSCVIKMDGTNKDVIVRNNYFAHKATSTAGFMPIATGKVVTGLHLDNNVFNLVGAQAATTGILITTDGSTNGGMISRNLVKSLDDTSEILVTASSGFVYSQNYYAGAADTSGYLLPAADA